MQGSREVVIQKRPRLILDSRFPVITQLNAGDKGQLLLTGEISGERVEEWEDRTDHFIKIIKILEIKLIQNKELRA